MADLSALETEIREAIAAASDEAALEAVRIHALGKKGSVSEQLKSLGGMTPEERKTAGPALNGLRDRVTEALAHSCVGELLAHDAAQEGRADPAEAQRA